MNQKFRWLAFAAIMIAGLGAAAVPWTFSQDAQRSEMATQILRATGMKAEATGRSIFAILPRPHLRAYDVHIHEPAGAIDIEAHSLRGDLKLLPLLMGRIEFASAELETPKIYLDMTKAPRPADSALTRMAQAPANSIEAKDASHALLGVVSVKNGAFYLRQDLQGSRLLAQQINLQLDWRQISKPLELKGSAIFHIDERKENTEAEKDNRLMQFVAWASKPSDLLTGEKSDLSLRLNSDFLKLTFQGEGALFPIPRFFGKTSFSATSLSTLAQWMDFKIPLPGHFDEVSLTADATFDPTAWSFGALKLQLDENNFEGAMSLRREGTLSGVTATLACSSANLDPFIGELPHPLISEHWNKEVFRYFDLAGAELDLRLSCAHASYQKLQLNDLALALLLKNGRMEINLAEATAYQGQIRGKALVTNNKNGYEVGGSATVENVDMGALAWDVFKRTFMTGTTRLSANFSTSGDSIDAFVGNLEGRGDIQITQGEIYGFDLDLALRRLERRPLSSGMQLHSGRTAFDQGDAKYQMQKGVLSIKNGVFNRDDLHIGFQGMISAPERTLDIQAVAEPSGGNLAEAEAKRFRMALTGAWDAPQVTPDARKPTQGPNTHFSAPPASSPLGPPLTP